MNVAELMEELEAMPPEAEVRLAIQPNYPFQHTIEGVYFVPAKGEDPESDAQDFEREEDYEDAPEDAVVYIAEGGQLYSAPYLPGAAASAIGWGRQEGIGA